MVLHQKSRWTNPGSRRLNAVRATQNHDELTLADLLETYLRLKSRKQSAISPRTLVRYGHALKPLYDYLWQAERSVNLLQADAAILEAFVSQLAQPDANRSSRRQGNTPAQRNLSRNSIDLVVVATKALFKALKWAGAITQDPSAELRPPNLPRAEHQPVLQKSQLETLHAVTPHENPAIAARDAAMLELGLSTLLRPDEIVNLDLQDLDLGSGVVSVVGKGDKPRVLPLTQTPLSCLITWLEWRPRLEGSKGSSALFLSASSRNLGGRISYHGAYRAIRRAFEVLEAEQNGLRLAGMHTLRRSGATRFYRLNKDLALLAWQLGHVSLTTTRRYVKLDLSVLRAALETVESEQHPASNEMG